MSQKQRPKPSYVDVERDGGEPLEEEHVHQVYNTIAPHFSHTRFSMWPSVKNFLLDLPDASLVADIGCGNGKYLGANPNICIFGSDRAEELAKICARRGFDCGVFDNMRLPYRDRSFDYAISIAVLHHFSTADRRVHAIQEMLRIIKVGGQILIYVWAFEQSNPKKQYDQQDVFVPWHLQDRFKKRQASEHSEASHGEEDSSRNTVVYKRYYHLFKEGELTGLIDTISGCQVVKSFFEKDNWVVIIEKTEEVKYEDNFSISPNVKH
eukprot:gb/GECH01001738.1/.p1 GENE.gb/GECH01001738.1/~~gb/GECH01001738.1/.p1  ORF type:complete len:266 (+),score=63.88 gb/GECH01001738.1/:1-798(+)